MEQHDISIVGSVLDTKIYGDEVAAWFCIENQKHSKTRNTADDSKSRVEFEGRSRDEERSKVSCYGTFSMSKNGVVAGMESRTV